MKLVLGRWPGHALPKVSALKPCALKVKASPCHARRARYLRNNKLDVPNASASVHSLDPRLFKHTTATHQEALERARLRQPGRTFVTVRLSIRQASLIVSLGSHRFDVLTGSSCDENLNGLDGPLRPARRL